MRGFGLTSRVNPAIAAGGARLAEDAGFDSLWINVSSPADDWIGIVRACAEATNVLEVKVGVIPADAISVDEVVAAVHDIPPDRLTIAFASGDSMSVGLVRETVLSARRRLGAVIGVGALGPRMCALAGEVGGLVLLNWFTPETVGLATDWVRAGATSAGRHVPPVASYVRVGVGNDAISATTREAAMYAGFPSYASHFKRIGVGPQEVVFVEQARRGTADYLSTWDVLIDEVVARPLPAPLTDSDIADAIDFLRPPRDDRPATER